MNLVACMLFSAVFVNIFANTAQAIGSADDITEGVVRKIDKQVGKITLKHSEIKSLDIPEMIMGYRVSDKTLLGSVQAGDKVTFKAISEGGKFVVIDIQPAAPPVK